jgi:nucleoside-specific outer membrane channel protein Tsx
VHPDAFLGTPGKIKLVTRAQAEIYQANASFDTTSKTVHLNNKLTRQDWRFAKTGDMVAIRPPTATPRYLLLEHESSGRKTIDSVYNYLNINNINTKSRSCQGH